MNQQPDESFTPTLKTSWTRSGRRLFGFECVLFFILLFSTIAAQAQQAAEETFATVITPAFGTITWERLVAVDDEPQNWLSYSGTHSSQRYSKLDSINRSNVAQLEMKWAYQIPVIDRAETVPLVVDGIMFITEAPSNVVAVDARTGREYWRFDYQIPEDIRICCGRNNRGVAILGEPSPSEITLDFLPPSLRAA